MKKLSIIITVLCCCAPLGAQPFNTRSDIRERIYIATDKDNYLSGEIVWMKLITTDDGGVPLSFSRVGYVELVGESESRTRIRVDMHNGVGEGTMVIPSTISTGYYRLVGYTRWMWNEGPEVFFDKRIGIVNPALAEVPRGNAPEQEAGIETVAEIGTSPSGGLTVSADRGVYSTRSEVRLDISGIPDDIHTLGVSVTAADPLGGFTQGSLATWSDGLKPANTSPVESKYEAEYEGALVTGKLVRAANGQPTYSSTIFPLLSFPGSEFNFFGGRLDEDGRVIFRTSRVAGYDEIVTTMRGSSGEPRRIDLDDPFSPFDLGRPMASFPIELLDRDALLAQSLAMQLQYSYVNDSLGRSVKPTSAFFERPYNSYTMSEWRKFATMREVMTEFVQLVGFYRIDRKWYLSPINRDFGSARNFSLVLLDGIPIIDHDIIFNYNPLLIDRIDVYLDRYIFGNNMFFGIVALYTAKNTYPELQPDNFTQILPYVSPQARRLFYAPDHGEGSAQVNRVPDYRHTLYWNADTPTDGEGGAAVSFSTSDMTGRYQVLVEGLTASGRVVSAVIPIEVK